MTCHPLRGTTVIHHPPAHTVGHRDGGVIAAQQGRPNVVHMTRTEIQTQAGPQGRKVVQFF